MELSTSHWQNQGLAGLQYVVPVGISRGTPRGKQVKELPYRRGLIGKPYRWRRLPDLSPSKELFEDWKAGNVQPDEYTRIYRDHLDTLGLEAVMGQLEKKSADNEGKPLVLLCWCWPGDFCHRKVWADWHLEKTGQEVPELPVAHTVSAGEECSG